MQMKSLKVIIYAVVIISLFLTELLHSVPTFSLERKGGAKSSRQIRLLRRICRAHAQEPSPLVHIIHVL